VLASDGIISMLNFVKKFLKEEKRSKAIPVNRPWRPVGM
jgi:hypothetical protein